MGNETETATDPTPETGRRIYARIMHTLSTGFWWCDDCESTTERIEDDHGQPAHCERCGSHRITWNKPLAA